MTLRARLNSLSGMIKSPVRYCGGKGWLVDTLVKEIDDSNPIVYVEPFVGGGSIALNVKRSASKILGDTNAVVMDMWRCLRNSPAALIAELARIEDEYPDTNEGYLNARHELNAMILDPRPMWLRRAAMFLYINARCFNGLWRTNSKGYFNVPYGKIAKPASIDLDEAKVLHGALVNARFIVGDFGKTLESVFRPGRMKGVAIYADPPYDETYDGYDKNGFGEQAQRALAELLRACAVNGARVWASNNDTEFVREIYSWAEISMISEQHNVGATAERRGKRSCVLIRG